MLLTYCLNRGEKRKVRSEENSRVSRKKRKTNQGDAVDVDQSDEESVADEPHSAIEPTVADTESTATDSMNIDTELGTEPTNNNNNNINSTRASAFSSLLSRISGLVSRMAEYRPSNNPSPNNNNETNNNQEENVDVDSREEPQAASNTNIEEAESNPVLNINVEIDETNEPPPETNTQRDMPPLETTVTNVNIDEDDFRSIPTAIASSSVSIDIPAARGDMPQLNNNDEPSDENSETSSTRFNLLGINNSITQGKYE